MKKNILVTGTPLNFQAIMHSIFSEKYTVHCVSTIPDAVVLLESRVIHMIIANPKLENGTVKEFLEKLSQMNKKVRNIPFILLTGAFSAELIAVSHRFDIELLELPVEPLGFEQKVDELILKNSSNYEKPDPVTGLNKKQYAEEQIIELLASGKKGALLLLAVDHYSFASSGISKEALLACRDILKSSITKNAVLAVLNSHAFMLFVPDLKKKNEIEDYGKKLIDSINSKIKNETVYVSIGLAVSERHGNDYLDLFQQCDLGLDRARSLGKNKACFYAW